MLISEAVIISFALILHQGNCHYSILEPRIISFQSFNGSSVQTFIMQGKTFRLKEKVQVLDAVTSIWKSAVILSLISDWSLKVKWSDWPESAIISVPEDSKENAAAWNIRKFLKHNYTCVISRRRNSRK